MKSVGDILKLSVEYIQAKNPSISRRDVEELIAFSLNKKRLDLYLSFDKPLSEIELGIIRKNLARLAKNEPLQYIEGKVQFYNSTISVNPNVLIPRPETEILVDLIAKSIKNEKKVLWDICTGTGCIGIALKKVCPELDVTLSDISQDALTVAKANADQNGVVVALLHGDLLEPFKGQKADYIVCNPPYIAEGEYKALDANVRDWEPKLALVSGSTGLECYKRLIAALASYCNPGATIWLEIGSSQASAICSMVENAEVIKDFSSLDRFIKIKV